MLSGLIVVIFLLLMVLIVFVVLGFPIWTIVHLFISDRSNKFKVIWAIIIFLVWPAGSFVYGIFASRKRILQVIASLCVVLSIAGTMSVWNLIQKSVLEADNLLSIEVELIDAKYSKTLSEKQTNDIRSSLLVLKDELHLTNISGLEKKATALKLFSYYVLISGDNEITQQEYADWMKIFEARNMLDEEFLGKKIKELSDVHKASKSYQINERIVN